MQISCPACKTRINVPDDRIKPAGTKVKCGKCAKIFIVKKKSSEPEAAAPLQTPKPAQKPAAAPQASNELDNIFGGSQDSEAPAPAASDNAWSGGDNFAAEMSNYTTNVRPLGAAREAGLFGSSEDLDNNEYQSPAREDRASLFGSADDLDPERPPQTSPPKKGPSSQPRLSAPPPSAGKGGLDDLFGPPQPPQRAAAPSAAPAKRAPPPSQGDSLDALFGNSEEPPKRPAQPQPDKPKSKSSMPAKESLDDLFGKGLDDAPQDDFVNQLLEAKPKKSPAKEVLPETKAPKKPAASEELDDLFSADAPPPPKPEPKAGGGGTKLDALFGDEPDSAPPSPKKEAKAAAPTPAPSMAAKSSAAEELAATLKLEPALKEDDHPQKAPPPPPKAAATPKKRKRSFPIKPVLYLLALGLIGGGVAAAIYVPAVNQPVMALLEGPLSQIQEIINAESKAPPKQPTLFTVSVTGGRAVTGGRGDRLYVIDGIVRNDYPGPRRFIKLQGTLLGADGSQLASREVFAGNLLNNEEIRGLPRVQIDATLNRSVGGGLQNFNVPPGNSIPFQIVFYDVNEPVQDKRVEAVGSEPGN